MHFPKINLLSPKLQKQLSKKFSLRKNLHIVLVSAVLYFTLFNLSAVPSSVFDKLISPLGVASFMNFNKVEPLTSEKSTYEVFGFAPFWTLHKLDNVDFKTLTTLAYFGIPVKADGTFDTTDPGFKIFHSDQATTLFQKAHKHKTRVVATITQMDNDVIKAFLSDPTARELAITNTVELVKQRGIDGINVDFEYVGTPPTGHKALFSQFVENLNYALKKELPYAQLTTSVYASSAKDSKLYDIKALGESNDALFMMAYDFATTGADTVMPTAPLYGHKEGPKYWYDISTAVEDFLALVPREKIILGVPYYGYNYAVTTPVPGTTPLPRWYRKYKSHAQTYSSVETEINETNPEISNVHSGWDEYGQVGWKAYKNESGIWRIIYHEDARSLEKKYDFIKEKGLAGVGFWALGFDHGRGELWNLVTEKFGINVAYDTARKGS